MEMPQVRLGGDGSWLELVQTGEDNWRVTVDWCSSLSADFTAYLTREEVADFAARCSPICAPRRALDSRRR